MAWRAVANPIATNQSAALMLEFMHFEKAADSLYKAVDENLDEGKPLTLDMVDSNGKAGKATTEEVVEDILKRL